MSEIGRRPLQALLTAPPARKWAFGLALITKIAQLIAFPFPSWARFQAGLPLPYLFLAGIASSTISAILVVELLRIALSRTQGWSNKKHFAAVLLVSATICAIQVTGAIAVSRPNAYIKRGWEHAEKGDYDGAIAELNKAIELDPRRAEAYAERGWARRHKGDYDGAIADYSRAIELDPKFSRSRYYNRGYARAKRGDHDGAIADFTKIIEHEPKDVNAYVGRGTSRFYMGDHSGAIEDWQKAIALKPDLERELESSLREARRRLDPVGRSKR